MSFGTAWRLAVGEASSSTHRSRRWRAILHGLLSGLASRALAVLVSLLSVPLTIRYLGSERFGVWALVGSILAWMRLMDIGIGNGLNNAISRAHGAERPDLIRAHVSTALVMLTGIAAAAGAMIAIAWHWIDWVAVFNLTTPAAKSEVGPAMVAAAAVFLLGFPTSVATRVYNAVQEGRVANAWAAVGNVASLGALFAVTRTQGGLPWLVIAVYGTAVLVDGISSLWIYYLRRLPVRPSFRLFNRDSVKALLTTGVQFFFIQIMALVVFESDNFVIAHFLGADHVARYSVSYKLFSYSTLIQSILFAYAWVAYSEAIARKDFDWVRRAFRANIAFSLGVTGAIVLPMVIFAKPLVHIWAGAAVVPSTSLVLLMAAWNLISAYCSPISCLFAASNHMRAQLVYGACSMVSNLALSIYLAQRWGVPGVIAATVISYAVFVCVPSTIDVAWLLRKRFPSSEPA
jgi:O-antigen/teichoic acid export membrane protein